LAQELGFELDHFGIGGLFAKAHIGELTLRQSVAEPLNLQKDGANLSGRASPRPDPALDSRDLAEPVSRPARTANQRRTSRAIASRSDANDRITFHRGLQASFSWLAQLALLAYARTTIRSLCYFGIC
jgi:hypothetical protein